LKKILLSLLFLSVSFVYSETLVDNLTNSRVELARLIKQQNTQQQEYNQLEVKYLSFQNKTKLSQSDCDKLSNEYNKFSAPEMLEVVDDAKLADIRKNLKLKKTEVNKNSDSLKIFKDATEQMLIQIKNTSKSISEAQSQINNLQADLFDQEILKEVWSEGYSEEFLTTDRSEKECNRLVREGALRDATDKAGKSYLESFSKVKDFVLIQDNIVTQTKTRVVEEDVVSSYTANGLLYTCGKVYKIPSGETFKIFTKVRIKVQGVVDKNPFRKVAEKKIESGTYFNDLHKSNSSDALGNDNIFKGTSAKDNTGKQWNIKNEYYGSGSGGEQTEQKTSKTEKDKKDKKDITYSDAVIFSMIIPGIGQQATGRSGAAQFYFWLTIAGATYYCLEAAKYEKRIEEYNSALDDYNQSNSYSSYETKVNRANKVNAIRDDLKQRKDKGDKILYATLGLYALNILDVLIFTDIKKQSYSLSPKIDSDKIGLTLSWSR